MFVVTVGHVLFLFLAVVDVVALGGSHVFFEVGDAGLDKDVVPLDEFLDVAVLHTVLIPVGQHLGEVVVQLLGAGLHDVARIDVVQFDTQLGEVQTLLKASEKLRILRYAEI